MKIKWFTILMILFPVIFSLNVAIGASEKTEKAPKAVVVDPNYEFDPVPEGTKVTHDFIIKNEGTETLEITKVKPG